MKTTQHILLCLLLWAFSAAHALAAHTDGETKFIKAGSDFSALDAGVNALGAALGAFATDRWILAPLVLPEQHYAGLMTGYRF